MYVYISEWSIIGTSDEILPINAEVVETSIEWPIELIDGKIVAKINKTKEEIRSLLISSSDLSTVDLEGVTFTDKEIGDIILERVFEGNPHAQSALLAKTNAYILSAISWDENIELLEEIKIKQAQINDVRAKFNLKSF